MSAHSHTTDEDPFQLTRLEWLDSGVAHLILDDPKSSANVMTARLQDELSRRLEAWESGQPDCRGLLVSSAKPKIFIAGADIKSIAQTAHFSRDEVIEFCQRGLRLYRRFSQLPFPTVALLQGVCLGGGLEFALALDWRIASETSAVGLPEVHLGLIPGWAATARVARLSSVETAMRLIGGGATVGAAEALGLGLVDQVILPAEGLLSVGLKQILSVTQADWQSRRHSILGPAPRLRTLDSGSSPKDLPLPTTAGEAAAVATVEPEDGREPAAGWDAGPWQASDAQTLAVDVLAEVLRANPRLHPRAPKLVIDLIAQSAGDDFWTACDRESAAMAEVYTSPVGQSLVHAFLLQDRAKKSPGLAAAPQPAPRLERIGIVGLGVMGKSIAQLMVHSPWSFVLYDQDPAVRQEVAGQIPGDRYTVVESWEGLRTCDAVIENVYEQLDCKRNVLRCLEQVVAPQTCLLSNTSVIPLADLAVELQHPERFCGLHFFNPIRETQLAEIATHPKSAATAVWIAAQLAKQLKKMVIVVGDGPGLVVNRLLMAVLNEAQRLLAVGYSIEQIDRAAADFGWRLGPFRIMDVIGLKTTLDAGTQIAKHLPGAVTAPPFLIPLIKAGRWGQQQGRGFYRYAADSEPWVDDEVMPLLDAYLRSSPNAAVGQSAALAHRLVAAMLVQAVAILERGQVRDAAEIDLCCLLALGFPPHKGGPLYWADHYPLGRLLEEILDPELAAGLRVACPAGHRFYPPPAAVGSTRAGEPSRTSS